jgi:hypothetical protein
MLAYCLLQMLLHPKSVHIGTPARPRSAQVLRAGTGNGGTGAQNGTNQRTKGLTDPAIPLKDGAVLDGPDLSVVVNGLKLPNPFVIGSGPPGTNYQVMKKAFDEGWGAVICKTLSLDSSKVCKRLMYDRLAMSKCVIIRFK